MHFQNLQIILLKYTCQHSDEVNKNDTHEPVSRCFSIKNKVTHIRLKVNVASIRIGSDLAI